MPAVHSYVVRQQREIKVTAASPTDAIKTAEVPLSMSDEDNRENGHPIPVETSIAVLGPFDA